MPWLRALTVRAVTATAQLSSWFTCLRGHRTQTENCSDTLFPRLQPFRPPSDRKSQGEVRKHLGDSSTSAATSKAPALAWHYTYVVSTTAALCTQEIPALATSQGAAAVAHQIAQILEDLIGVRTTLICCLIHARFHQLLCAWSVVAEGWLLVTVTAVPTWARLRDYQPTSELSHSAHANVRAPSHKLRCSLLSSNKSLQEHFRASSRLAVSNYSTAAVTSCDGTRNAAGLVGEQFTRLQQRDVEYVCCLYISVVASSGFSLVARWLLHVDTSLPLSVLSTVWMNIHQVNLR